MQSFSRKLLAVLLTLSLGLSPLQGVMAGYFPAADQGVNPQHMVHMQGGAVPDPGLLSSDHEQCGKGDGCAGSHGSSGHCASCVLAVPLDYFYSSNTSDTPRFSPIDTGTVGRLTFSLFRPPRA